MEDEMDEHELFEKMKLAIDQEYDAYLMYKDIADNSGQPELKVIFDRLADEEKQHREVILKRYRILKGLTVDGELMPGKEEISDTQDI